jgi:hypothetical protein
MKDYLRKRRHVRFIRRYITDLHWDTINTIVAASSTEWTNATTEHLCNNGVLIRKYERRMRWLKY